MKKTVLLLGLTMMINQSFAQDSKEVLKTDKEVVAQDLEKEAGSAKHDKKTEKLLLKVAKGFKDSSVKLVIEMKKLDICDSCEEKPKQQVIVRNQGRKLGKASAWVSTTTSKPFLNATSFVMGVTQKKEKNQDISSLYKLFLNHSKEFDKIYLEAQTPEEMVELMLGQIGSIVETKSNIILKEYLVSLGITRELPENLANFEITEDELAGIDMEKVSPEFINNHPEYKELRPVIGDVTKEELEDIIISGYFDKNVSFNNYKLAMPKLHEGAASIVGQIFGPKIVLGVVSKSLAGLYALPVVLADIGTGVSTAICLQADTKEKFSSDKDLGDFCSYVVNRSAYELMKSRSRGYIAGKNVRLKIEAKFSN